MQYLVIFLAASVALAVLKSALSLVLVLLIGALLLSAIWRPAQTLGVLILIGWTYLLGQHGIVTILLTAILLTLSYLKKNIDH